MPKLTDKDATGIPVLDEMAYGRWPHLFTRLALKYNVPDSFIVALLFLWEATVGSANSPGGYISLTQIPVRLKYVRKYIAALCAAKFFEKLPSKWGSHEGTYYEYDEQTSPADWDKFFSALARIVALGGLDDDFSPEKFGAMVANAVKPRKHYAPAPGETIRMRNKKGKAIAEWLEEESIRKR